MSSSVSATTAAGTAAFTVRRAQIERGPAAGTAIATASRAAEPPAVADLGPGHGLHGRPRARRRCRGPSRDRGP